MSSGWLLSATFGAPVTAALAIFSTPFSTDLTPSELSSNKNSCWGFEIGRWNEQTQDTTQVKLLKLGFWAPTGKICRQDGFKMMNEALQDKVDWVDGRCQSHDTLSERWKRRTSKGVVIAEVSRKDKKSWRLATFSECIKLIKIMAPGELGEELSYPVIGEFI